MSLLEIQDLRAQFSTRDGVVRAVDGISLQVEAGRTVGLVGESGCGKSATALAIMQLLPKPAGRIVGGSIKLKGVDLLGLSEQELNRVRAKSVSIIFQDPMTSLNPVLSVGRQISEAVQLHLGMSKRDAHERVVQLMESVNIPDARRRIDDYPHQFSGGMRQRLMIAMALSCDPDLVIADEPTTALDVTIQSQILELLKRLADEYGTTFVFITHDLGVVAGMTDEIHVMYAGQVVESAETVELFTDPQVPYTWGLLQSIPRIDEPRGSRLRPIDGMPPDLVSPPAGCRFAPRCQYRRDICDERPPELLDLPDAAEGHRGRCWATQDVPDGGWLIGTDWRSGASARSPEGPSNRTRHARSMGTPAGDAVP